MNKFILKLSEERFSYFKYIIFTYFKCDKIYEKNVENDVFFIPFKKSIKPAYYRALSRFLKRKKVQKIMIADNEFKGLFNNEFSIIFGKNIYSAKFCDILEFMSENKLYEYEIVFISDNIKEIKEKAQMCVKKVKNISVLTSKPFLYESMRDYFFEKYGIMMSVKTKKDRIKKHKKIYVNCGANRSYEKNTFKNVNMLDIYNVYEGAYGQIIFETNKKSKEYTKVLKCPHSAALAEFLEEEKDAKNLKIVNIKK